MKYLTQEQYERFKQNGYLVIDDFLTPEETARTRNGIDKVCQEHAEMTKDADGFNLEKVGGNSMSATGEAIKPGLFRKIQGAVAHIPEVADVFASGKMLNCMEDLMGPNIYYHSSKVMFKPPGGSAKPWHQDAAYWRQFDPNQITVWIAMDNATEENGCIWAIPGSHKLGHIPHVKAELQVDESRIDLNDAVPVPVPAGGLLIFHSLVLHQSAKNDSDKTRWAIICDYDCLPNGAHDLRDWTPPGMREDGVWPLREAELVEA